MIRRPPRSTLSPSATLFRSFPPMAALLAIFVGTTAIGCLILALSVSATGNTPKDFIKAILQLNIAGLMNMFGEAWKGFYILGVLVQLLASLVVGIRCSGSITAEREN